MSELSPELHSWMASGRFAEVDGVELFYRQETSAASQLPWLVCFHGFPTSSWDWHLLLPYLVEHRKVLVFDFPGYGLSAKPPQRSYRLSRQFDAAQALLQHLGIERFDLLAHDMGNSVACEFLRRRELGSASLELLSLTLLNGGVYMELHRPLITQRLLRIPLLGPLLARFSSWRLFRMQYPQVYAKPGQFAESHYQDQWSLMLHNKGRNTLAAVAGYMRERVQMGEQWLGPLHRLDLPLHLIWGQQDPIAVEAIASRLKKTHSNARLDLLDQVGHYPQLEAPQAVARLMGFT